MIFVRIPILNRIPKPEQSQQAIYLISAGEKLPLLIHEKSGLSLAPFISVSLQSLQRFTFPSRLIQASNASLLPVRPVAASYSGRKWIRAESQSYLPPVTAGWKYFRKPQTFPRRKRSFVESATVGLNGTGAPVAGKNRQHNKTPKAKSALFIHLDLFENKSIWNRPQTRKRYTKGRFAHTNEKFVFSIILEYV